MQQTEPGKPGVDLHAILRVGGAVFAVLLALLLAAACLSSYMEWLNAPSDVIAYWQGGTHAMNGEPLYVESHDQAHYRPFLYPPAFAAFFSMFVRLGPRFGLALWAVTHLLFGFLLIRALHAWVAEHVKKPWPWLAVLILLVLFEVFWMELQEGQDRLGKQLGVSAVKHYTGLRFALSAEEALAYLLSDPVEHERRRQELRNAFSDTICHQIATINGMVAGARALLDELEPAAIARGSEQGLLSGHRASWKVFVERWERLATRDGPLLAALFGPEFARVYTEVGEELRAGWKRALPVRWGTRTVTWMLNDWLGASGVTVGRMETT